MESLVDPEILKVFCFWSGILILKQLLMVPLTVRQRFKKGIFISPEDTTLSSGGVVSCDDEDVERVRRAHHNDLENIPVWFAATLIWLCTHPPYWLAGTLIRTFVIARIVHTIVYAVFPLPQPTRAIAFFAGYLPTGFMAVYTLIYFYKYV